VGVGVEIDERDLGPLECAGKTRGRKLGGIKGERPRFGKKKKRNEYRVASVRVRKRGNGRGGRKLWGGKLLESRAPHQPRRLLMRPGKRGSYLLVSSKRAEGKFKNPRKEFSMSGQVTPVSAWVGRLTKEGCVY